MPNIMDYIAWRGDVTFEAYPVNEIDNLIFSLLSYVDFDGILPTDAHDGEPLLREVAKEYFFRHYDRAGKPIGLLIPHAVLEMFRAMAEAPRYRNLRLTGYVNEVSEKREMQFSALTICLPDHALFVAFRGTDDTVVGWKEDFNLAYMDEVPSQHKARAYLNALPLTEETYLYVGGHSKGGNLSVWGAVHADERVRNRIVRIFSNDGPGFVEEVLRSEAYLSLADRMTFLIPESSFVGLLLGHGDTFSVVKSSCLGLAQHNALTWEVMGASFVRAEGLSRKGIRTDTLYRARINAMNREERRTIIQLVFDALETTGAKTLTELHEGKVRNAVTVLRTLGEMDKETKDTALFILSKLFDIKVPLPANRKPETAKTVSPSAVAPAMPIANTAQKPRVHMEFHAPGVWRDM